MDTSCGMPAAPVAHENHATARDQRIRFAVQLRLIFRGLGSASMLNELHVQARALGYRVPGYWEFDVAAALDVNNDVTGLWNLNMGRRMRDLIFYAAK